MSETGVKEDCFALHKNRRGAVSCSALNNLYCEKGECRFYKAREQMDIEAEEDWDEED